MSDPRTDHDILISLESDMQHVKKTLDDNCDSVVTLAKEVSDFRLKYEQQLSNLTTTVFGTPNSNGGIMSRLKVVENGHMNLKNAVIWLVGILVGSGVITGTVFGIEKLVSGG